MNEKSMVTIIIPVYDVEKYLDKCVTSAVEQTYEALEIILIDDGSHDSSGRLCDEWGRKDNRVRVIHKENGGLSSARNAGLDICKGDYIYFLDSDDYIDLKAIEIMVNNAIETNAQIVQAPIIGVYHDRIDYGNKPKEMMIMNTAQAIKYDLGAVGGGTVSACSKLFARSIFEGYRFAEGKLNEDHFAIVDLLSKANIIAFEPRPLYFYVHRPNSITTNKFSTKALDDLEAAQKNYEIICRDYPENIDVAEFRIDFSTLKVIDKMMLSETYDKALLEELVRKVRENKMRMIKSKYLSIRRKISLIFLLTNTNIYRKFVRGNARRNMLEQ